jgi:hypothetical protein
MVKEAGGVKYHAGLAGVCHGGVSVCRRRNIGQMGREDLRDVMVQVNWAGFHVLRKFEILLRKAMCQSIFQKWEN